MIRCTFHVKVKLAKPDRPPFSYYYDQISITGPWSDGALHTDHPPMVGDLIMLFDQFKRHSGAFKVVSRMWMHSQYGSVNFPHGKQSAVVGPGLDIIVIPSEDQFRNQVTRPEED